MAAGAMAGSKQPRQAATAMPIYWPMTRRIRWPQKCGWIGLNVVTSLMKKDRAISPICIDMSRYQYPTPSNELAIQQNLAWQFDLLKRTAL